MIYLKAILFITIAWLFLCWMVSRTLNQPLKQSFKDWWKELFGAYILAIVLTIIALGPIGRIG